MEYTVKVELDGRYAGWWAVMDDDPSARQLVGISSVGSAEDGLRANVATTLELINEWNFVGKSGAIAPLTVDGVMDVPAKAIGALKQAYLETFDVELPNSPGDGSSLISSTKPDQRTNGAAPRRRSSSRS